MFEIIFDFIAEIIGFKVGAFLIRVFTFGYIKPTLSNTKQPFLISLLGGMFMMSSLLVLIYMAVNF